MCQCIRMAMKLIMSRTEKISEILIRHTFHWFKHSLSTSCEILKWNHVYNMTLKTWTKTDLWHLPNMIFNVTIMVTNGKFHWVLLKMTMKSCSVVKIDAFSKYNIKSVLFQTDFDEIKFLWFFLIPYRPSSCLYTYYD